MADGSDLFVANDNPVNLGESSITEIYAPTGRLVRVVSGASYHFDDPDALAIAGPDLFVANGPGIGSSSVTEVNASTGALVEGFRRSCL